MQIQPYKILGLGTVTATVLLFTILPSPIISALTPEQAKLENKKLEFEIQIENKTHELEEKKFQLEQQKLELEMRQLNISSWNAWIGAGSLAIPLIVAVITLIVQVVNRNRQDNKLFQAKVAEIVMNTNSPEETKNRAEAVAALFPRGLPENFASSFDPKKFMGSDQSEGDVDAKIDFFKVASAQMQNPEDFAILWRKLFPADTWTDRITDK